ncbi:uncharacterized protein LOC113004403 isoform X2 [Solenopsis invicta]|nr:uncharacterized protein LOC113004403 isoform X2 [Solenopsis invicta]
MSKKYKHFLNLNMKQKRRRLDARKNYPNVCQFANNESGNMSSDNESVQISASHRAPSTSTGDALRNDESTTDIHTFDTSDGNEDINDSEGTTEEEMQEQEINTDETNEEDEESENNADDEGSEDNADVHSNENMSNSSENNNMHQNLNDLKLKALRQSFLLTNLNHKQGNILLNTLREFPFNLTFLPKHTRTLLKTPTDVASRLVQYINGGEYLYLGFKSTLIKKLKTFPENTLPETIQIDFNTDGAQIHKSGTNQFWSFQYRIYNCIDKRPIVADVFKGTQKPSNCFQFFEYFVQELVEIREESGILINDRWYPIQIRCFIADAPARAFALNHYGHISSNACSKCKIEGRRSAVTSLFRETTIFPGTCHPLRMMKNIAKWWMKIITKGQVP